MSIFFLVPIALISPVDFKKSLRKCQVALSNLRVRAPSAAHLINFDFSINSNRRERRLYTAVRRGIRPEREQLQKSIQFVRGGRLVVAPGINRKLAKLDKA